MSVARLTEPTRLLDKDVQDYLQALLRDLRSVHTRNNFRFSVLELDNLDSVVIVKNTSDLEDIDSTKTYFIDGAIDLGSFEIEVPEGGVSFVSDDLNIKGLYSSTPNHTMFKKATGASYAGNVTLRNMFIATSGTNSKLFDLDNASNFGALEMLDVNIGNFGYGTTTSIGEISSYRQFRCNGCGFILCADGITFNGTMVGGIVVENSIALSLPSMTLLKEGTSFSVQNMRSNVNFLSVDVSSILVDFTESNIAELGGLALTNVRTNATDIVPNISPESTKARFKNCNGVPNTYVGAQWQLTSSTITTITTVSTPVKVAGTTTYANEYWFSNTTDNAFVYDGDQTIEIEAKGLISFSGGNNDQINVFFRKWDDSASVYVDMPKTQATLNGGLLGTRAEGVGIFGYVALDQNDRIEVWVENITDNSDVTALTGALVSITERPS